MGRKRYVPFSWYFFTWVKNLTSDMQMDSVAAKVVVVSQAGTHLMKPVVALRRRNFQKWKLSVNSPLKVPLLTESSLSVPGSMARHVARGSDQCLCALCSPYGRDELTLARYMQ